VYANDAFTPELSDKTMTMFDKMIQEKTDGKVHLGNFKALLNASQGTK